MPPFTLHNFLQNLNQIYLFKANCCECNEFFSTFSKEFWWCKSINLFILIFVKYIFYCIFHETLLSKQTTFFFHFPHCTEVLFLLFFHHQLLRALPSRVKSMGASIFEQGFLMFRPWGLQYSMAICSHGPATGCILIGGQTLILPCRQIL